MEISDPRIDPRLVPEGSTAQRIAKGSDTYRELPAVVTPTGRVITRWSPTDAERAAIVRGEDIYVTLLSAGRINPMFVTIGVVDWRKE